MKLKEKIGIFFAAALLTLVGFNFIAAPSVDVLKAGYQASHGIVTNYVVEVQAVAPHS